MTRNTDLDWQKIADEDPYWGVLSDEAYRGAALADPVQAQFFESGKRLIGDVLGFVRAHVAPSFEPDRALDFGCGVGRLLIPMARLSRHAVGVDVSPRMLEIAARHLEMEQITNTSLILGDDDLSGIQDRFNFINSYIVLQHIPPIRGIRLIQNLLHLLDDGGIFSLQLTYAKSRKFFAHESGHAEFYRRDGSTIYDLVPVAAEAPEGHVTMFDYDLNQVMLIIGRVAAHPLMVLPTNHDGHLGVHFVGMKAG
jgi:SAM-dependent methyltransferase